MQVLKELPLLTETPMQKREVRELEDIIRIQDSHHAYLATISTKTAIM